MDPRPNFLLASADNLRKTPHNTPSHVAFATATMEPCPRRTPNDGPAIWTYGQVNELNQESVWQQQLRNNANVGSRIAKPLLAK